MEYELDKDINNLSNLKDAIAELQIFRYPTTHPTQQTTNNISYRIIYESKSKYNKWNDSYTLQLQMTILPACLLS